MWDKQPKLRLKKSEFKILHSIIYPLARKNKENLWGMKTLAYDCVWPVNNEFPAVWWSTIAASFRRCDWLFPPSAREVSPGNRSNYKSTRERVDSKGLYGRWRLHLMGSCSDWLSLSLCALKMIILQPNGKHVSYLPLVGNKKEKRFCLILLVVLLSSFSF